MIGDAHEARASSGNMRRQLAREHREVSATFGSVIPPPNLMLGLVLSMDSMMWSPHYIRLTSRAILECHSGIRGSTAVRQYFTSPSVGPGVAPSSLRPHEQVPLFRA